MSKEKDCTCITGVAKKAKEHVIDQNKKLDNYNVVEARWEHASIFPTSRLFVNYMIKYTFKKKDGSTSKPKNEHVAIFFTYCPFCGKKFPPTK